MSDDAHKEAVLREWCRLNELDYEEFLAVVEKRAAEIKADLERMTPLRPVHPGRYSPPRPGE